MFNTLERFIKKFRKFSDNDEFAKRALRHIEWILSGEHEINVSKNQVTLYGKKIKVVLTLNKMKQHLLSTMKIVLKMVLI